MLPREPLPGRGSRSERARAVAQRAQSRVLWVDECPDGLHARCRKPRDDGSRGLRCRPSALLCRGDEPRDVGYKSTGIPGECRLDETDRRVAVEFSDDPVQPSRTPIGGSPTRLPLEPRVEGFRTGWLTTGEPVQLRRRQRLDHLPRVPHRERDGTRRPSAQQRDGRSTTERAIFTGAIGADHSELRQRIINRFSELGYDTDGVM
jgi:hypothetical protein